jgi:hypothetical protein
MMTKPNDDRTVQFQEHGYRREAALLKKENRALSQTLEAVSAENQDMRASLIEKFPIFMWPRTVPFRRELLVTLHNVVEYCRAYGEVVPHFDFKTLGFKDHRTLHRSCKRFACGGILVKVRANPSAFTLNPEVEERDFERES